jgi:hypothetical protein
MSPGRRGEVYREDEIAASRTSITLDGPRLMERDFTDETNREG